MILTSLSAWNGSWTSCLLLHLQIVDGTGDIDKVDALVYLALYVEMNGLQVEVRVD